MNAALLEADTEDCDASVDGKNRNFVMLYRNEKKSLIDLGKKDASASVLLNFLILHMDTENCLIVSGETLAECLGWSLRTVRSKVKVLYDLQMIDILKSGNTNIYCINSNLAWSTYANKKQYAKFRARVLISKSEQESNAKIRASRNRKIVAEGGGV